MVTGKGRRLLAVAVAAFTGWLAACGSSSSTTPPAASSAPASAAASASATAPAATPTASTSPTFLDPFLFPEKDTPIGQATAELQRIWAPYQVTIIPSRHTLETMAQVRSVGNLTNGALDDATAQSFLVAEYRDNAFSAWAERFVQPDFLNNHLQGGFDAASSELAALRQGLAINDPPCDLYPTNPTIVKLDDKTTKYLTQDAPFKASLHGPYAIVETFVGPCDVTYVSPGPSATPLGSVPTGGATALIAGHLTHDPVLGDLWFADGAFGCGTPGPPQELCQAAAIG